MPVKLVFRWRTIGQKLKPVLSFRNNFFTFAYFVFVQFDRQLAACKNKGNLSIVRDHL